MFKHFNRHTQFQDALVNILRDYFQLLSEVIQKWYNMRSPPQAEEQLPMWPLYIIIWHNDLFFINKINAYVRVIRH
jgi:hypothetical protein